MRGEQRILELPSQSVQHEDCPESENHVLSLPHNLLQQRLILTHLQQRVTICSSCTNQRSVLYCVSQSEIVLTWTSQSPLPWYSNRTRTETWTIRINISFVNLPQQLVQRMLENVRVIVG